MEGWATRESLELFAPSGADDPELLDFWGRMLRSGVSPATVRTLGEMYISLDVRPLLAGHQGARRSCSGGTATG